VLRPCFFQNTLQGPLTDRRLKDGSPGMAFIR
jgi:hypothetical protein